MAYEIPQQLEYKEKIIFGLTFRQLAYLFLFAPLTALVFFKSGMNIYARTFISINLSALAVGFIFLELDHHLKVWTIWLKSRKIVKKEKLEKFVPVKEIKDDLIFTKDNRKIAILKIEPINFSIKPDGAKEAITSSFQKFLNGIDFPIQILMNTESLDLKDYFKEIKKKVKNNKQFKKLFKKYKEHLKEVASQENVLNRNFYLIIPEKNDINIQLQICQKKLDNLGLDNVRVKDDELRKIVCKFFESDNNFIPIR